MIKLACAALLTATTAMCATDPDGVTLINQASLPVNGSPYFITKSGSYRLASDLASDNSLISIQAAAVTLDLNGFSVLCGSCSAGSAIYSSAVATTIRNGYVLGYGTGVVGNGITFDQAKPRVDHVTVSYFGQGIIASADLTVSNSTVSDNAATGIQSVGGLILTNSLISGNGKLINWGIGVDVEGGVSLITGNSIVGNPQNGLVIKGMGGTVTNNSIMANGIGIDAFVTTGVGSNTFAGNGANWWNTGIVSMKDNACSGGVC